MADKILMYAGVHCPYCVRAEAYLKRLGVTEIEKKLVDNDPELREKVMLETGQRTVPQIYINGVHIGGYSDLLAADKSGRLEELLETHPRKKNHG